MIDHDEQALRHRLRDRQTHLRCGLPLAKQERVPFGLQNGIDASIEVQDVAADRELRQKPGVERAVAPAGRVSRVASRFGGNALSLGERDRLLERERPSRRGRWGRDLRPKGKHASEHQSGYWREANHARLTSVHGTVPHMIDQQE